MKRASSRAKKQLKATYNSEAVKRRLLELYHGSLRPSRVERLAFLMQRTVLLASERAESAQTGSAEGKAEGEQAMKRIAHPVLKARHSRIRSP